MTLSLTGCLYERCDGMFTETGRFSSRVYMRMFLPGTISPETICKVGIISSRQSGMESVYMIKIVPLLLGSRLSEPRSRFARTGRNNVINMRDIPCVARSPQTSHLPYIIIRVISILIRTIQYYQFMYMLHIFGKLRRALIIYYAFCD